MPRPPEKPEKGTIWPHWPNRFRTSSSQQEGAERQFSVMTTKVNGEEGQVTSISCVKVDDKFQPIEGTEFELKADLVLLAMGFVHPVHKGLLQELGVELDSRNNVQVNAQMATSLDKVFATGDAANGASLVVTAIASGRRAARRIDEFLISHKNMK